MTPMINFSAALLKAVAAFLMAEPIIYLFAVVIMCFLAKLVHQFMP